MSEVLIVAATTVFEPPKVNDVRRRDAMEAQIRHFGQTPSQVLTEPHPARLPLEVRKGTVRIVERADVDCAFTSAAWMCWQPLITPPFRAYVPGVCSAALQPDVHDGQLESECKLARVRHNIRPRSQKGYHTREYPNY